MYDSHPVKRKIMDMGVGNILSVSFKDITKDYYNAIIKSIKKETGRKFTQSVNKGQNSVTLIRLS